jgi:large subunit ribosomal protein L25
LWLVSEIPVDVSPLALGATLHAKQVLLPEGVRLVTDGELPVAACVMPKVEEVSAPSEEAAAAGEEPEVLKQKKPEEIAAEEEAKAQAKEKEGAKGKEEKKG